MTNENLKYAKIAAVEEPITSAPETIATNMVPETVAATNIAETVAENSPELSIKKPSAVSLDKFKSKRAAAIASVETLQTALPHHTLKEANDYCRLHPDEENWWSPELCFVQVPIKGQKRETLHLIEEELAQRYLPSGKIKRFRLALATKPYDKFFLCHVPTQNLDNSFNETNLQGCLKAKTLWTELTSRKEEGVDSYKVDFARDHDAFPEPKWPTQTLDELIMATFAGRMIDRDDHPALLRLIGAKQAMN